MNKTYLSRKIFARLSLRAAARMICCILTLALWGPARAGAQETQPQPQPQPLSLIGMSNVDGKLALTYKLKTDSSTEYAWFYRLGTNDPETEFSGTLTGVTGSCPTITIESTKGSTATGNTSYATLLLEGVSLSTNTNDNLIEIASGTKPLSIQATGNSDSRLSAGGGGDVISNINGGVLLLDGGTAGLEITASGTGSYGIDLATSGPTVTATLLGKITVETEAYAVRLGNATALSAVSDAKVTIASKHEYAIYYESTPERVKSPFLQWGFATAPANGQTLEVKDADGSSFSPAIQFTTSGKKKTFAVNVAKDTGYTLWLGGKQLMDKDGTSVFTATEDQLFSFSDMRVPPTDWSEYAQTADVGPDGTDVAVSGTTYTVKNARGLAWIAWVTNNEKTTANIDETYTASYPASAGFKNCTVTLANDISLARPAQGVAIGFKEDWIPIGTSSSGFTKCFQGTFEGGSHTITGMKISSASVVRIGLFGYLYKATVQNLTMASCDIDININSNTTDARYLGSIAGKVTNGKIINCHNQCAVSLKVTGASGYVGGIAGESSYSVISACSNRGAVTIEGTYGSGGGIVANNYGSSIVSCFNTGDITATATDASANAFAGGIVANCQGSDNVNVISHCYSTGQIKAKAVYDAFSGGIVGSASSGTTIGSCFATGAVSAESSGSFNCNAHAGGILGRLNSTSTPVTIQNCLALTTGGVKALGDAADKQAGRIVGYGQGLITLSNNSASTKIQLTVGTTTAAPTDNIGSDKINGANTDLGNVDDYIASWAGPEDTKAFTAIETFEGGKLPKLKAIDSYGADGLPAAYLSATVIPNQPDLLAASYLTPLPPLALPSGDTETITLSCSNNKWSYKKGANGAETRFSGRIEMQTGSNLSTNKLIVATATGNPTLTLDRVAIWPTDGAALTVNEGCDLTIAQTRSSLYSSDASILINKGTLRLSGDGFHVENYSTSDTHYCLDNSGTFSVLDPAGSVIFHCARTAIHNTGTLTNAWMECRFMNRLEGNSAEITFNPLGASSQISVTRYNNTLATTVTAGEEYQLKKNRNTPQKGFDSEGMLIDFFPAPEADGGVATFTEVSDWKTVEISGNQNFSGADCANENVTVKPGGVLTIDTENASVFNLELEGDAQVVTTNALKVYRSFTITRWLDNKWMTFGSPILLTARARPSIKPLYAATGYTAEEADSQGWKEVPLLNGGSVDLAADSPYLLAAEDALTEVGFSRSTFDTPFEIPATATVASGEKLENGVFLFRTNPNLANLTLRGIYVLNAEGTRFERQEQDYVLKPFEAYITANAVTRMRVRSVGVADGSGVTANEIAAATAAVRVWAAAGELRVYSAAAAALTVVRSDGRTVYAASIAPGDTRLALPAGIYMIRINNITYKIAL
ncbi:hypothetical protein [Parabacteroides sp.]